MDEKELAGRLPLFPITHHGKKLTKEQLLKLIKLIEGTENAPKRGKCACGGYFQDWHSHASECIVINRDGKDYNEKNPSKRN